MRSVIRGQMTLRLSGLPRELHQLVAQLSDHLVLAHHRE